MRSFWLLLAVAIAILITYSQQVEFPYKTAAGWAEEAGFNFVEDPKTGDLVAVPEGTTLADRELMESCELDPMEEEDDDLMGLGDPYSPFNDFRSDLSPKQLIFHLQDQCVGKYHKLWLVWLSQTLS